MTTIITFRNSRFPSVMLDGTLDKPHAYKGPRVGEYSVRDCGPFAEVPTAFGYTAILNDERPSITGREAGFPRVKSITYSSPESRG